MKKLLLMLCFAASFLGSAQGTIQSVSPNTGVLGETLLVTITGQNTQFTQVSDTYNVSFYNQLQQQFTVNAIDMISDTELVASITIPLSVSPGPYDLAIYTWNGGTEALDVFNVTTTLNTISGNIRSDVNNNGCDPTDAPASGVSVTLYDGTNTRQAYTNADGDYIFYVPAGTYTVTPQIQTTLFAFAPVSANFTFATENNLSETQDFCLSANGVYNDVYVTLIPIGPARPGFDAMYRLSYKNRGNQTLSGNVALVYDDARLDFVSATEVPSAQSPGSLNWNYANLMPYETRQVNLLLNVNSPMETPSVNIGDILDFTATVNPVAADQTPADNVYELAQVVTGPMDPNDKAVAEGAEIPVSDVDKYLHYLIRFQNMGTFLAENVRVKDVLSANLDASTMEVISASHPYRATITNNNELEFFFDNIFLPAAQDDEPGSNGFVSFRIKPAAGVGLGSVIENTAGIYFDFNFPVITNTVTTTVTALGTREFDAAANVSMYPNPARDVLHFQTKSGARITSVKIFNHLGQLVKSAAADELSSIAVSDLHTGTYLVQIATPAGTSAQKLIKY